MDKLNRGKGFRNFDNTLLHYKEYVNIIKKTITECKINLNHCTDKGLVLEVTQNVTCISYTSIELLHNIHKILYLYSRTV